MFYLTTYSTPFIYGYMASDIWLRTILIVRMETCCCHIGYSFRLVARVLLYAPSHRQDSTYHGICYTSCGALAGTRNSFNLKKYHITVILGLLHQLWSTGWNEKSFNLKTYHITVIWGLLHQHCFYTMSLLRACMKFYGTHKEDLAKHDMSVSK